MSSELDEWDNQFIDEDYVVTFSTTKPKGKADGEKVFNMARKVWPELRAEDATRDERSINFRRLLGRFLRR